MMQSSAQPPIGPSPVSPPSASDDCGHKIQISVATPQSSSTPAPWATVADHVLAAPFLWTLLCVATLIAWRRDLRRLLQALIARIESGDKIDIVGVKMESKPDEPLIYSVILDEEGSINGIDLE